jgi:hypothetical protein
MISFDIRIKRTLFRTMFGHSVYNYIRYCYNHTLLIILF